MLFLSNETLMARSTTREVWHAERRKRYTLRKREAEDAKRAWYMAMPHHSVFVPPMPCSINVDWHRILRNQQTVAGKLYDHCRELRRNRRLNRLVGILSDRYVISKPVDLHCAREFFKWVKDGETEEQLIAHVANKMKLTTR
jgi:hypothetical protein